MTEVLLVCDSEGQLIEVSASGHAGFAVRGSDIVCAAESALLRTVMQVLEESEEVIVQKNISSRGKVFFRVVNKGVSKDRLICTADFIRCGMKSLAEEYPAHVQFREKIVEISTED